MQKAHYISLLLSIYPPPQALQPAVPRLPPMSVHSSVCRRLYGCQKPSRCSVFFACRQPFFCPFVSSSSSSLSSSVRQLQLTAIIHIPRFLALRFEHEFVNVAPLRRSKRKLKLNRLEILLFRCGFKTDAPNSAGTKEALR